MDFIVSSAALLKGIIDVSKAVPAKSSTPILENFLFEVEDGELTITASDQELTLRTVIGLSSVKEEGSIAVPARQIMDLVKTIPDQPVSIKTTSDSSFECVWNNGNSSLPFFPAEDYPEIRGAGNGSITIEMPAETLIQGIGSTVYATADDEMRPAMNGIFFDIDTDVTTLVASDSHKLICYTTGDVQSPEKASFILHKKAASVLRSIISKDADSVSIEFDENTAVFSFERTIMVCRLIVGKYPKYRDVIPQNNANILKISREQLLGTLRRVAVCANKASNYIKLDLRQGQLEISAQDLGFAIAAYEKLSCDYNGDTISIGFKSSFFIEILSNLNCENMVMKFADSRRAALILPSDEEASVEKVCGIIMPIMVS